MSRQLRERAEQARAIAFEIRRSVTTGRVGGDDAVSRLALVVEGLANTVVDLIALGEQRASNNVEVEMGRADGLGGQW